MRESGPAQYPLLFPAIGNSFLECVYASCCLNRDFTPTQGLHAGKELFFWSIWAKAESKALQRATEGVFLALFWSTLGLQVMASRLARHMLSCNTNKLIRSTRSSSVYAFQYVTFEGCAAALASPMCLCTSLLLTSLA